MTFTKKSLANYYGAHLNTFYRRLKLLEEQQKFTKQSPGKLFDEKEALTLSQLLNFTIPQLKQS